MRRFTIILTFVLCLTAWPARAEESLAPKLSISPAKYDLTVIPGQLQQATVKLTNRSSEALPFHIEIMDFAPKDQVGGIDFGKALPGRSAKDWLSTNTKDLLLKADETRNIEVTISPPDTIASGSYFAVVMFEASLPPGTTNPEAQATIVPWIGELFLLQVGEPELTGNALAIKRFDIPKITTKNSVPVRLEIENTTNFHLAPETKLQLKTLFGTVAATSLVKPTTIMPGESRIVEAKIVDKRPLGIYRGVATVQVAGYSRHAASGILYLISLFGLGLILAMSTFFGHGVYLHRKHGNIIKGYRSLLRKK